VELEAPSLALLAAMAVVALAGGDAGTAGRRHPSPDEPREDHTHAKLYVQHVNRNNKPITFPARLRTPGPWRHHVRTRRLPHRHGDERPPLTAANSYAPRPPRRPPDARRNRCRRIPLHGSSTSQSPRTPERPAFLSGGISNGGFLRRAPRHFHHAADTTTRLGHETAAGRRQVEDNKYTRAAPAATRRRLRRDLPTTLRARPEAGGGSRTTGRPKHGLNEFTCCT